jgi:nucleoporin POM34
MRSIRPYEHLPLLILQLLFLFNIVYALYPLVREPDDLSDIPLTASQRALIGLNGTATPPPPGTSYITPPRYQRSPTPRNSSPSSRPRRDSGSPLARSGSITVAKRSTSGYSPSPTASPLWQRTLSGQEGRRASLGRDAPTGALMGSPAKDESVLLPSTPSPTGRAHGMTLNSRWLYERGRRASSGSWMAP